MEKCPFLLFSLSSSLSSSSPAPSLFLFLSLELIVSELIPWLQMIGKPHPNTSSLFLDLEHTTHSEHIRKLDSLLLALPNVNRFCKTIKYVCTLRLEFARLTGERAVEAAGGSSSHSKSRESQQVREQWEASSQTGFSLCLVSPESCSFHL